MRTTGSSSSSSVTRLERVAAGVLVQALGRAGAVSVTPVRGRTSSTTRRDVERCQAQAVAAAVAHEAVERLEVAGARPTYDHDAARPPIVKPAVDERQRLHRGQVGPLGIVDHDEQRRGRGCAPRRGRG